MQSPLSQGVEWFHPGEIVIIARVSGDASSEHALRATVRDVLGRHAGEYVASGPDSLRSYVFGAPGETASLAFLFQKLQSTDSIPHVKEAVETLHGGIGNLSGNGVDVLGVMPHWHTRAHENFSGGSPGSFPGPVRPGDIQKKGATRWRYRAKNHAPSSGGQPVPVAVLDTQLDLSQAHASAERLRAAAGNEQLLETVEWLQQHDGAHGSAYAQEWREIAGLHPEPEKGEPKTYQMGDHGLFVAGLIHGLAPNSPVRLVPALNETGVGDLSVLLAALREVLDSKESTAPQIINLSLGFRPHPAHLTAAWHGLDLNEPTYARAPIMFDATRDQRWVASHSSEVARRNRLLLAGLDELGHYLSLNNCLVVAAAGNDSLAGEVRLDPRLPARSDTVLGVAATASDPRRAASYSNVGDEGHRGDHIATLGGERDSRLKPVDGVVGVYSGAFPGDAGSNETGWAYWSGTSFATALVSGIAANIWSQKPDAHASEIMGDLHEVAAHSAGNVPELRVPAIAIEGEWSD